MLTYYSQQYIEKKFNILLSNVIKIKYIQQLIIFSKSTIWLYGEF